MIAKKIGIIGCGTMGEAIFSRLSTILEKSTTLMISEMNAVRRQEILEKYKVIVEIDNNYVVKYSDVIILAVKPQDLESVLKQEVCCGISKQKLLISIAAGVSTRYIENAVGKEIPVVRAMPNMPAVIGKAMTVMAAGSSASAPDIELAMEIFGKIGDVICIDEKLMDAATAISGSGPAYFFYLVEALTGAAVKLGFDKETAEMLAVKTAVGSAGLLEQTKEPAQTLRCKVASKGGTTEAALAVFEKDGVMNIVEDAVLSAYNRSKELSRA